MPLAALVGGSIFCMHGGISPDLSNFEQIRRLPRPMPVIDKGIPCDLLWADPDKSVTGKSFFKFLKFSLQRFSILGFQKSTRGISYLFGPDAVTDFCEKMDIEMIIRAHQVVQ